MPSLEGTSLPSKGVPFILAYCIGKDYTDEEDNHHNQSDYFEPFFEKTAELDGTEISFLKAGRTVLPVVMVVMLLVFVFVIYSHIILKY